MKDLEKFVRENRGRFDDQEPLEGHRERFLSKLESEIVSSKRRKSRRIYIWLSAAAAVMIVGIVLFSRFEREAGIKHFERIHAEYLEEVKRYEEEIGDLSYLISGERDGYDLFFLNVSEDEPIPFLAQLPEELDRNEKARLLKEYYDQKLKGLRQMKLLMSEQLIIEN